jgi:hypothetical protein
MQETTKVKGYFNGNNFPIELNISRFNTKKLIQPGGFVTDEAGRMINDPVLDSYCRSGPGLSRQMSQVPVEVIHFIQRDVTATQFPIRTGKIQRSKDGMPTAVITDNLPNSQKTGISSNSVTGMSCAEAEKRGLIRQVKMKDDVIHPVQPRPRQMAPVSTSSVPPLPKTNMESLETEEIDFGDDDVPETRPAPGLNGLKVQEMVISRDPVEKPIESIPSGIQSKKFPCLLCPEGSKGKIGFDFQAQFNRHVFNRHPDSFNEFLSMGKCTKAGVPTAVRPSQPVAKPAVEPVTVSPSIPVVAQDQGPEPSV